MSYGIQRLLLMLPHIPLMPELHFKCPYPIQGLLQQFLCICCIPINCCVAPCSLSRGVVQISYLLHAVFAYTRPVSNQRIWVY
jgi:hypothetical protein